MVSVLRTRAFKPKWERERLRTSNKRGTRRVRNGEGRGEGGGEDRGSDEEESFEEGGFE